MEVNPGQPDPTRLSVDPTHPSAALANVAADGVSAGTTAGVPSAGVDQEYVPKYPLEYEPASRHAVKDPAPIGDRAASGLVSSLISTVVSRGIAIVGQVVLAWYLTKDDFGIAGMAISASLLITLVREWGVYQLLLRHPKRFNAWAVDAFWFSALFGLIGALMVLPAAPLIARVTQSPGVYWPTILLGLCWIIATPGNVFYARLSVDLRFRFLANLMTVSQLVLTAATIILAYCRVGAWAIVLPQFIQTAFRAIVMGCYARLNVIGPLSLTRWRVIFLTGWPFFGATVFASIILQAGTLILGVFKVDAEVGVFYFAYQTTQQLLVLLGYNLASVLQPVFGHIRDDVHRHRRVFVQCCGMLCVMGIPPFFLQAALARPMLQFVWHDRWLDAVWPFAFLSIGLSFKLLGAVTTPLLYSQGRMREYLVLTGCSAVAFAIVTAVSAEFGSITTVAIATAIYYFCSEAVFAIVAMENRPHGYGYRRSLQDLSSVLFVPTTIATLVFATAWTTAHFVQARAGPGAAILCGGAVGGLVQLVLMATLSREMTLDMINRMASAFPVLRRVPGINLFTASTS